jgi:hypothetical protein
MSDSEIQQIITGELELDTKTMYQILSYLENGRLDIDEYGTNILTSLNDIKSTERIKNNNGTDINIKYHLGYEVAELLLSTIETKILVYKDNVYVKIVELKEKKEEKEKKKEYSINVYKFDDPSDQTNLLSATLTVLVSGIYHQFSLKKHKSFSHDEDFNIELFNKRFSFSIQIKKKYDLYVSIYFNL